MSKTVEELYEEVRKDEKLQKDLSEALQKDKEAVISFMRDNGCEASIDEAKDSLTKLKQKAIDNGELTSDQLEQVSGGTLFAATVCGTFIAGLFGSIGIYEASKKC